MARLAFHGHDDGSVSARLPGWLRRVVRDQLAELDALLAAHEPAVAEGADDPLVALTGLTSAGGTSPADEVVARLRPDGYRPEADPDGERAADFRRFTEADLAGLQRQRIAVTREALGGGDRVRLDPEQAQALLGALNDLRLALGTRLGVTEDLSDEPPPDDPAAGMFQLYHLLGALQHHLLVALGAPAEF